MSALTKAARGRDCQVRLEGCNGGGETTVLAHYRLAGTCGMGIKPDDEQGAWACSVCHDHCDRRIRTLDFDYVRLAHAEGCLRTLAILKAEGYQLRKVA